jgi:MoaA/NifB/PqqE/SkfB family radical SAM enzyme
MFHTFHIELTTFCNASCPGCRRTIELSSFIKQHLDIQFLINIDKEFYKNLKKIQICGNLGDPILHPKFFNIIEFLLENFDGEIEISTNGEPHNNKWWAQLATLLKKRGYVIFGIDGMSDTHSVYRAGTDWQTIIDNASSFIDAGGRAHWQFIPFAHNEHQIIKALKLSRDLKFEHFFLKDERDQEHLGLIKWSKSRLSKGKTGSKQDNCLYTTGTIFMAADGKFSPCCYLGEKTTIRSEQITDFTEALETLWVSADTTPKECKRFCHRNLSQE